MTTRASWRDRIVAEGRLCSSCHERPANRSSRCAVCVGRARATANRAVLAEYRQRPCADCGLVDPAIMDLDHVPERGKKSIGVAMMVTGYSLGRLKVELAKCD